MADARGISKSIKKQIRSSKKRITVLFTDIVASARYWDSRGDEAGRLMVHTHNRLSLPIIRKYHGKVVKTIGDALMVKFRRPASAVKAAIGIQQRFLEERRVSHDFPKVRIGIHTGHAIVEKDDIFGDMVNIAHRIQERAKGDEILLSSITARRLSRKVFMLEKRESFRPKGLKKQMTVYRSNWRMAKNYAGRLKRKESLLLKPVQKWEIAGATVASLAILLFLLFRYVRFFLLDQQFLVPLFLNPTDTFFRRFPGIPLVAGVALLIILLSIRVKRISHAFFKLVNGGLGFCIAFFLVYLALTLLPARFRLNSGRTIYQSRHMFVEVVSDNATVHEKPFLNGKALQHVKRGFIFLLSDVAEGEGLTWNRVFLGRKKYGWIVRVIPPKLGVPQQRVTLTYRFTMKWKDIYCILSGLIGFMWGFLNFRIRPR